jgi:phosphatidylserine/phosphatidylglycerophosphate/cardiolipin synthase-like enzyme
MTRKRRSKKSTGMSGLARGAIVIIFLIIAALIYFFEENQPEPGVTPEPTTVASGGGENAVSSGLIQTYFTTPSLVYPDRRDQRGPSPLLNAVVADIEAAETSIDVAVFDLDLTDLAEALIAAKQRGVAVRAVIDSENLEAAEVAEVTGQMEEAGIPITFDAREAFMHNKFMVVDGGVVWLGSWNMTENDTYRNNNNFLRLRSQLAAEAYHDEFEIMFDGTFGGRKGAHTSPLIRLDETPVQVLFSPEDGVASYVLEEISRAQSSVKFMTFSYTSSAIADAMLGRLEDGVRVEGVFERQNAQGTGAVFNKLSEGGVDVLVDGNCYILHHKTIIIDDRIVITGSYNFTNSAERDNDENLVIISDPGVARAYLEEYARIRALAESPLRCG